MHAIPNRPCSMCVSCSHGPRAVVRGFRAVREPCEPRGSHAVVREPHGPRKSCVVVREPREPRVVREPHGPREPRAVARCIDSYWGLDGADSFPILNT